MEQIKKSCRVCLFTPGIISINETFGDIISTFFQINVLLDNESFPTCLCENCAEKLEIVYNLKIQIEESDIILRKLLKENLNSLSDTNVKNENSEQIECYFGAESNEVQIYNEDNVSSSDEVETKEHKKVKMKNKTERARKSKVKTSKFCDVCGKGFSRLETVKNHARIHTGEKPFQCNICLKNFVHKSSLAAHLKTHSDEKSFICEVCSKQFKIKLHLKQHLNTHLPESEKRYKCDLCPTAFHEANQLKYHKAIHDGEKKHTCSHCGKSFISKRYLNRHFKTVHLAIKQHKCSVCQKTFSDKSNLTSHFRIHTGEKPYQCKYCDSKFNQSTPLVRHTQHHLNRGDPLKSESNR